MTLHPAATDTGVVFRRNDLPGAPEIPATWRHAVETPLCTTLECDGIRISTVEHLLSALAGVGIDNVVVELDGPEVPIMDGSAAPFVCLIECAGVDEQAAARKAIRIRRTIEIADGERTVRLLPAAHGLGVDFEIDFDSPVVARQDWSVRLSRAVYKRDIARARTFGFLHDVDRLRESGLAQGGSLDNAVVIASDGILNEGGLRYDDEFVRHKVLDAIGDLYLAGAPIIGRFQGAQSGHALNLRLIAAIFADAEAWGWSEMSAADVGLSEGGGAAVPARAVAASA
jgi:UDP-3-O-[3-hydroxymyristoyl] N-acetylglucosamine deacetylase